VSIRQYQASMTPSGKPTLTPTPTDEPLMYALAKAKTVPNFYAGIAVVEGPALPPDQQA